MKSQSAAETTMLQVIHDLDMYKQQEKYLTLAHELNIMRLYIHYTACLPFSATQVIHA